MDLWDAKTFGTPISNVSWSSSMVQQDDGRMRATDRRTKGVDNRIVVASKSS